MIRQARCSTEPLCPPAIHEKSRGGDGSKLNNLSTNWIFAWLPWFPHFFHKNTTSSPVLHFFLWKPHGFSSSTTVSPRCCNGPAARSRGFRRSTQAAFSTAVQTWVFMKGCLSFRWLGLRDTEILYILCKMSYMYDMYVCIYLPILVCMYVEICRNMYNI